MQRQDRENLKARNRGRGGGECEGKSVIKRGETRKRNFKRERGLVKIRSNILNKKMEGKERERGRRKRKIRILRTDVSFFLYSVWVKPLYGEKKTAFLASESLNQSHDLPRN